MNIFFLSADPKECAQFHADVHLNSQIKETCQMLGFVLKRTDKYPLLPKLGKPHENNPCVLWLQAHENNQLWTYNLLCELLAEYSYRKMKQHAYAEDVYAKLRPDNYDPHAYYEPFTAPPSCMPEWTLPVKYSGNRLKDFDYAVCNYRHYYCHKEAMFKRNKIMWSHRDVPSWYHKLELPEYVKLASV